MQKCEYFHATPLSLTGFKKFKLNLPTTRKGCRLRMEYGFSVVLTWAFFYLPLKPFSTEYPLIELANWILDTHGHTRTQASQSSTTKKGSLARRSVTDDETHKTEQKSKLNVPSARHSHHYPGTSRWTQSHTSTHIFFIYGFNCISYLKWNQGKAHKQHEA